MAAALLVQGKTAFQRALRGVAGNVITHVGFTTASDAFNKTQTAIDPTAGTNVFKTATFADVTVLDTNDSFDATATVDGSVDTSLVGLLIRTISLQKGNTRTDALTRSVRTAGIGVEATDVYTISVRGTFQDNS